MKQRKALSATLFCLLCFPLSSVCWGEQELPPELPPEVPLWENQKIEFPLDAQGEEKVRAPAARPDSPSGSNRVFSHVSNATYTIHRPDKPNGVGLVICPGGGYRDVWLDREGHDFALWLKQHGVTSLVLKYRTNSGEGTKRDYEWKDYLPAVEADARQAIRTLRNQATQLKLNKNKIGICGFSAGGNLALLATIHSEPKNKVSDNVSQTSGMPDFAGLFYPWFRDEDYSSWIKSRMAPQSATKPICPMYMMNASDDRVTPADKCVEFYSQLLKVGVSAELHVFSKGSHGFDLGQGRGESAATWPTSFVAWLRDRKLIDPQDK